MQNKRKTILLSRTIYAESGIQVGIAAFVAITLFLYFTTPLDPHAFTIFISIFTIIAASILIVFLTFTAKITIEINSDFIYYEAVPNSPLNIHKKEKVTISFNDITAWQYYVNDDEPFIQHGIDSIFTLELKKTGLLELHISNQKLGGKPVDSRDVLTLLFRWLPSRLQLMETANSETNPSKISQVFSIFRGFFKLIHFIFKIFKIN